MTTTTPTLDRIVHLGAIQYPDRKTPVQVFAHVQYAEGKLSITGVEGPLQSGNAVGSSGQIEMHYRTDEQRREIDPAPGWTRKMIGEFFDVWNKWHLNDMQAASPRQREYIDAHPAEFEGYPYFENAVARLTDAGLEPDTEFLYEYPHDRYGTGPQPYRYGTAWLKVDVPDDVLRFLAKLPVTNRVPAWI